MPAPIPTPCEECGGKLSHDPRFQLDTNASCNDCNHRMRV